MRTRLDKRIAAVFLFGIVLLMCLEILSLQSLSKTAAAFQMTEHSRTVYFKIAEVNSRFQQAESSSRGFALSGNPSFLRNYETAAPGLPLLLQDLAALTAADAQQARQVSRLTTLVEQRMLLMRELVQRRRQGLEPALELVATGRPQKITDEIQLLLDAIAAQEKLRLDEKAAAEAASARNARWTVGLISIPALLILAAAALGVRHDLRRRAKMEDALRASEEQYRDLFDNARDLIQSVRPDGTFHYVNPSWRKALGYTDAEISGLNVRDVVAPDCREAFSEVLKAAQSGQSMDKVAVTFLTQHGARLELEGTVDCKFDAAGRPVRTRAIFHDVTTRNTAERALRESESRFRTLAEYAPIGIFLANGNGACIYTNTWWQDLVGSTAEDSLGDGYLKYIHPDDTPRLLPAWDAARAASRADHYHFRVKAKDGGWREVEVNATPVTGQAGGQPVWVGTVEDVTERHESRRLLETAESRLRQLLKNSTDLVVIVDEAGYLKYISPAVEPVLGYVAEDYIGRNVFDLFHPDDVGQARESLRNTAQQPGPAVPLHFRTRKKDGTYAVLEVVANNVLVEPAIAGIVINARDVTARANLARRVEVQHSVTRLLAGAEDLRSVARPVLRLLTEGGDYDGAVLWSVDGAGAGLRLIDAWPQEIAEGWEECCELCAEQIARFRGGEAGHEAVLPCAASGPETPCELTRRIGRGHRVGVPIVFEREYLAFLLVWHEHPRPVDQAEGRFLEQVATEIGAFQGRKMAEATKNRLSEVLESSPDFIGMSTAEGRPLYVNRAGRGLVGMAPEAELPPEIQAFHPSWACELIRSEGIPTAVQEGIWSGETALLTRDNVEVPVLQAILAHKNSRGEVQYLSTIMHDISERRAIDRMKDEFVSVASHELRTPLTSIHGALRLLGTGKLGTLTKTGQRMLDIAVSNTERLVRLVNDMLDLERMESGAPVLQLSDCDGLELARRAADLMRPWGESCDVRIRVEGGSCALKADPDKIIQTLTNLLSNAVKFSSKGGTVRLSCASQQAQVLFQVRDNGRGIPKDKLEHIFGRFQQADVSDSRQKGGSGLGLAISRAIVDQHRGRMWVESEVGKGSVFSFVIPADTHAAGASASFPPKS